MQRQIVSIRIGCDICSVYLLHSMSFRKP